MAAKKKSRKPTTRKLPIHRSVAAAATPSHVCTEVFGIPELLENILSFFPAKNIFGVIRVSKHQFKAVIDSSPALKRKMFLDPGRGSREAEDQHIVARPSEATTTKLKVPLPLLLNPMLEGYLHPRSLVAGLYEGEELAFTLEDYCLRDRETGDFLTRSSFLDTYLTDPPCSEVSVDLTVRWDVSAHTGFEACVVEVGLHATAQRTGPTIRDIMMTISHLREYGFNIYPSYALPKRRRVPGFRFRSPWSIPSSASLNDVLRLVEAEHKMHATSVASRRTTVHIGMYGVIVQIAEVSTA